jgi:hypothetical protein
MAMKVLQMLAEDNSKWVDREYLTLQEAHAFIDRAFDRDPRVNYIIEQDIFSKKYKILDGL